MTDQIPDQQTAEDEFLPRQELLDQIDDAVQAGDAERLNVLLEPMHGADIADIIERLAPAERRAFLTLYSGEIDGEILSEIDDAIRDEVIEQLPPEVVAEAVREMDSDDVVDLVEDMDEPERQEILAALDATDRAAVQQSLAYPEYSAGRLMQSEVVTAPEHWTVGETIDFLRQEDWLPDQFYHVVLVDPRRHPLGYVTVYPEDLSVEDQFQLFNTAEQIVAVHGAGLGPLLYRHPNSPLRHLVEILPCGHMTDFFRLMAQQVGVPWTGVRGRLKPEYVAPAYQMQNFFKQYSLDNFEVDPESLERALAMA